MMILGTVGKYNMMKEMKQQTTNTRQASGKDCAERTTKKQIEKGKWGTKLRASELVHSKPACKSQKQTMRTA